MDEIPKEGVCFVCEKWGWTRMFHWTTGYVKPREVVGESVNIICLECSTHWRNQDDFLEQVITAK